MTVSARPQIPTHQITVIREYPSDLYLCDKGIVGVSIYSVCKFETARSSYTNHKMSTICQARRCKEGPKYKVDLSGTQGSFHIELECEATCLPGKRLCNECITAQKQGKHKNQSKSWQGFIGEEFPEWSRIVGSVKYLAKLKERGLPIPEDMGRPKKVVEEVAAAKEVAAPKEKKPRAKRAIKIKDEVVEPVALSIKEPVQIKAIESIQSTLHDVDVHVIKVRKFEIHGHSYYLDSNKYKLYKVGSDKKPGAYHGRWNPEKEEIDTSFPDSDREA